MEKGREVNGSIGVKEVVNRTWQLSVQVWEQGC